MAVSRSTGDYRVSGLQGAVAGGACCLLTTRGVMGSPVGRECLKRGGKTRASLHPEASGSLSGASGSLSRVQPACAVVVHRDGGDPEGLKMTRPWTCEHSIKVTGWRTHRWQLRGQSWARRPWGSRVGFCIDFHSGGTGPCLEASRPQSAAAVRIPPAPAGGRGSACSQALQFVTIYVAGEGL